jgi:signal transduction histidine kinase
MSLTEYFTDRNDKVKAKVYSNNAYDISVKTNNKLDRIKALSYIVELNNGERIIEYKYLIDSIASAKQKNENKFSYIKYNYNKKEKEAQEIKIKYIQSELKAAKEKSNKIVSQFIGIFLLLISIFSYFILKSKHKKDKIQQVYITETRISKKVHDELANDVYQVISKLQGNLNVKDEILDDLENLYARARDISKENGTLDVNDHYEVLLNDLLLSYKNNHVNIITRGIPKIDWNSIDPLKKITLYRVLQELMVNMKKHSQATNVALTFNESNNKINVTYTDNGKGCKIKKGTGLLNMENRIKSIKGTIIFESEINKGFKAKITV